MVEPHSRSLRDGLEQDSSVLTLSVTQEDSENGSWPPAPLIVKNEVRGMLADRIRNKLGVKRRRVFIIEETCYGGYSEYTQENSTWFTVECGKRSFEFHPPGDHDSWTSLPGNSTVFARFQFWLRSSEDPEQLWAEGTTVTSKRIGSVTVPAVGIVQGSLLWGVLENWHRGPIEQMFIVRLSNGRYGVQVDRRYRGRPDVSTEYTSLGVNTGDSSSSVAETDRIPIIRTIADRFAGGRGYY